MSDDAKRAILARRARFVAAALAGVSIACGKEAAKPEPCLEPMIDRDAEPMPCLSPPPMPVEEEDAGAPRPCLEIAPPPKSAQTASPRPCLTPVWPKDEVKKR